MRCQHSPQPGEPVFALRIPQAFLDIVDPPGVVDPPGNPTPCAACGGVGTSDGVPRPHLSAYKDDDYPACQTCWGDGHVS